MLAQDLPSNRHPVDRLAEVRATIRSLEDVEKRLKVEITTTMGDRDSLGGVEYIATKSTSTRKGGLDEAALKKAGLDPDTFRKAAAEFVILRVERRVADEGDAG